MNLSHPESNKHFKIHRLTLLIFFIILSVGYGFASYQINAHQQLIQELASQQIELDSLHIMSPTQLGFIWGSVIIILGISIAALVEYALTLQNKLKASPSTDLSTETEPHSGHTQQLERMLDHIDAILFLSDSKGRYLFLNQKGRLLLGYVENAISGNCHEDWLEAEYAQKWHTLPFSNSHNQERHIHSHHVSATFKVITQSFLHPLLKEPVLAGLAIDLSDYKTAEQALIQKNTELEKAHIEVKQANLAKSSLLANLSHELRTPLNAMLGYLQLLQRENPVSGTQSVNMEAIRSGGEKLLAVINDMADLAKLETKHLELVPEPCQLLNLFDDLSQRFRQQANTNQLQFHFRKNQLPDLVEIDIQRFRQICINLFDNALQYTETGEIDLDVQYKPGQLTLLITDTRPSSDSRPDELKTADASSYHWSEKNLSLLVTEGLIKKMRGQMQVEHKIPSGQCFRFCIPVKNLEPAYPSSGEGFDSLSITGYRRTDGRDDPLSILVVDDQRLDRQLLKNMLASLGFNITEAADGAEAVNLTAEQRFDLIFMDMMMPKINGLLATKTILSRSETDNRCIVALTACAYEEDYINTMAAGCCAYLTKPYKIKALLQVVEKQLPLEWES